MGSISSSEKWARYVLKSDMEVSYHLFLPKFSCCEEPTFPVRTAQPVPFSTGKAHRNSKTPKHWSSLELIVLYHKWHFLLVFYQQFWLLSKLLWPASLYCPLSTLPPHPATHHLFLLYVLIDTGPIFHAVSCLQILPSGSCLLCAFFPMASLTWMLSGFFQFSAVLLFHST